MVMVIVKCFVVRIRLACLCTSRLMGKTFPFIKVNRPSLKGKTQVRVLPSALLI